MRTIKFAKPPLSAAFAIAMAFFAILPESAFNLARRGIDLPSDCAVAAGRITFILLISILAVVAYVLFLWRRKSIILDDGESVIEVKYGDLLEEKGCHRVISFDECYTTRVGSNPEDIKPTSICGQYLSANSDLDIGDLVNRSGLVPESMPSRYAERLCYAPGSVVSAGDDLLVAFARLNEDGRAEFTKRTEYLDCLTRLWDEIYKHCDQRDVAIPILGSGQTSFSGGTGKPLTQQELLNMIIWSYKLSANKIKRPQKLRIVCRRQDGFSLNKVDRL